MNLVDTLWKNKAGKRAREWFILNMVIRPHHEGEDFKDLKEAEAGSSIPIWGEELYKQRKQQIQRDSEVGMVCLQEDQQGQQYDLSRTNEESQV